MTIIVDRKVFFFYQKSRIFIENAKNPHSPLFFTLWEMLKAKTDVRIGNSGDFYTCKTLQYYQKGPNNYLPIKSSAMFAPDIMS